MGVYVVTMYRNGNREDLSYVLGVWNTYDEAAEAADAEYFMRGAGKYGAEIVFCSGSDVTKIKCISEKKAFEEWCASEKLEKLVEAVENACMWIPQCVPGKKVLEDVLKQCR